MSSVSRWKDVSAVPSDRALLVGQRVRAVVLDELSGELLERIDFAPEKSRAGYCLWPKDFSTCINAKSSLMRAGVANLEGGFDAEASSYRNHIHAAVAGTVVFTTAPHLDNWSKAGSVTADKDLTLADAVVIEVSNAATGTVYETLTFTPTKGRQKAAEWRQDLARHINANSLYIKAGRLYTDSEVDKEKIKTAGHELFYPSTGGNTFWVPKGSGLLVTQEVVAWREINQIQADRAALPGQKITAFAFSEVTDAELERIPFTPDKKRAGYCLWPKDFATTINAKSKLIRAGVVSAGDGFKAEASSYRNRLYTARSDVRAFTTSLHLDNWVKAGTLSDTKDLTADKAVVVRVCNDASGKVHETLTFTPLKDRLKAAEWRQDLAKHINAKSSYVKAGRLYTDQEVDKEKMKVAGQELFYPSTGINTLWVPVGSHIKVVYEVVAWRDINQIRSDRAAPGQKITAFVMDDATDDELERHVFTPAKGREGDCLWTKDFANSLNSRSSRIRAGVLGKDGAFKPEASSYLNRIYTAQSDVRAFSTALDEDNWVKAGSLPAPKALKQGDVVLVRVCGEATGKIIETLSFTVGKERLKAAEWRQDLARFINATSQYLRAGRLYTDKEVDKDKIKKEGHALFYPSTGENPLWLPRGSGLCVELEDWLKNSIAAEPIPHALEVDPFTGKYQANVAIGTLVGNKGKGPTLDLVFNVSKGRSEFQFSLLLIKWVQPDRESPKAVEPELTISLSTGETHVLKRTRDNIKDTIVFPAFKVNFTRVGECEIVHRDGTVEAMTAVRFINEGPEPLYDREELYLPTRISTATGSGIALEWLEQRAVGGFSKYTPSSTVNIFPIMSLLRSIKDDSDTLLETKLSKSEVVVTLYPKVPDRREIYSLEFEDRDPSDACRPVIRAGSAKLKSISATRTGPSTSSVHFQYSGNQLVGISSSLGGMDTLAYDAGGRVCAHVRVDGVDVQEVVRSYKYSVEKNSAGKIVGGRTTIDVAAGSLRFVETLVFSNDGQLNQRVVTQGGCATTSKYIQTADAKTDTKTARVDATYSQGGRSRTETSSSTFDKYGNLVKLVEKGITKEWTYYSAEPSVKRVEANRTRVDAQASVFAMVLGGWALDFLNPIGWGMNIFYDRGLTWGTDYEYEIHLLPSKSSIGKKSHNLPVELSYPGDPNFFTWHVESERAYTEVEGKRVDLYWSFYGYSAIPVKGGSDDHPAVVPSKRLTLHRPVSKDLIKIDGYEAGEIEELTYYTDPALPASYGEVKKVASRLLAADGSEVADSGDETSYTYKLIEGGLLETTVKSGIGSYMTTVDYQLDRQVSYVDRHSNKTAWTHDAVGRPSKVTETDADGKIMTEVMHSYEALVSGGRVVTSIPDEPPQRVQYDSIGREIRTQAWISPAIGWRTLSSTEYGGMGRVVRSSQFDYYLGGRLLCRDTQHSSYDDWGGVSRVRSDGVRGRVACVESDPIAQSRTEWIEADGVVGHKIVTTENANGSPVKISVLDAKGAVLDDVEYAYTAKAEVSRIKGKYMAETSFEYDHFGRQTKQDVGGIVTRNQYPAHTKKSIATKATVWDGFDFSVGTQVVDKFTRVTQVERNGRITKYTYEGGGERLGFEGVAMDAGSSIEPLRPDKHEKTYDAARLRLSEKFQGKTGVLVESSYRYSLQGRAVEVIDPFAGRTFYRYDRSGQFVGASGPLVYSTLVFDGFGRQSEEHVHDKFSGTTARTSFDRDVMGREVERCVRVTGFDDLVLRRTLDGAGRLTRADTIKRNGGETVVRDERFSYSATGRLEKYVCNKGQNPHIPGDHELMEQSFGYDPGGMNQCSSKAKSGPGAYATVPTVYTFKSATQSGKISTGELATMSGAVSVSSLAHDDHGRLCSISSVHTSGKAVALAYNKSGRIHSIQHDATHPVASYVYDESETLVSCISPGHKDDFIYKGGVQYGLIRKWGNADAGSRRVVLLNESDACHVQRVTIVPGKGAQTTRHTLEIKDAHGSLVASYDLAAGTSRFFAYTPYGYRKVEEGDASWIGFNGVYVDPHLGGIYHLGNGYRVYDPTLQRFHAPDEESPFGAGGGNAYGYCMGEPVNNMDPSGRVVVGRGVEHSPSFLSNKWGNETFFAVLGIGLGIATGGAGLGILGAVFGGVIATGGAGLGFAAAATEESDPDLSTTLRLLAFAIDFDGTFASIKPSNVYGAGRGIAAGMGRASRAARYLPQGGGIQGSINTLFKPNGKEIGRLYVGGLQSRKLVISSHGAPNPGRITLPKNMTMEFYTRHGTYLWGTWSTLADRLKLPAKRPRVGKIDTPDYHLSAKGESWYRKTKMPAHNLKDMPAYFKRTAVLNNVDILEITGDTSLARVFKWLESQNTYRYTHVVGSFCRGSLPTNISQKWLRVGRRLGLHYVYPFKGTPTL